MGDKGMVRGFGVALLVTMLLAGVWSLTLRFVPPFSEWLAGLPLVPWLIEGGVLLLVYLVLGWILRARLTGDRPRLNKLAGALVVGVVVLVIALAVPLVWPIAPEVPEASPASEVSADSTQVPVNPVEQSTD
jgi:hypothetical protein